MEDQVSKIQEKPNSLYKTMKAKRDILKQARATELAEMERLRSTFED